ncbi:MAG: hypothetical protein JST93_19280 [Acidobacteria bacterium]|nr:hypothetical protein [Acidobacteriota bacterium]
MEIQIVAVRVGDQRLPEGVKIDPRLVLSRDTIWFPKELLQQELLVDFRTLAWKRGVGRAFLGSCRQRTSMRFGLKETGLCVSSTRVKGRIAGCRIEGDWWIRAMPMFGDSGNLYDESSINPATGEFTISSTFTGARHVFVIGRGKDPIHAFAFNVTQGGTLEMNDVGVVPLGGLCPQ